MVNKDRLLEKYKKFVKVNSYSCQEREIADILKKELKDLGCSVKEDNAAQKINGNCGNIIAKLPGNHDYSELLFAAHMDRIDSGNNVDPKIIDDVIIGGNGSSGGDDVAGLVTILEILNQIKQSTDHAGIKVIFTVAEEAGLLGAKNLSTGVLDFVDYGLVFDAEGSPGTIIYSSPAYVDISVNISSKEKKEIYKITTSIISELNLGHIDSETTVRVRFEQGWKKKELPNAIKLKGEIISYNSKKLNREIIKMRKIITDITEKYQCELDFNIKNIYSKYKLSKSCHFITILKEAAANCNLDINLLEIQGGSDANIFNNMGVPTVNLGTGLDNVHTAQEKVYINDMVKVIEYSLEIINKIKESSHV